MGATYTRQSSAGITDGAVIEASDINDEFDQLLAAFVAASGHTHDGTAAEGGPVTKLLGTSLTLGDGTAGTDITVTFDGETNDGVLTWMEDEDLFKFSDAVNVGVDDTGYDVKFFGATTGKYWLWDESADGVTQIGALTVGVDDAGHDVKFFGDTASAYMLWDTSADDLVLAGAAGIDLAGDIDVDGTANLDIVDIDGAVQVDSTITVGADDQGYDIKFFGDTASAYMLWDTSADDLVLAGAAGIDLAGDIDVDGTANLDIVDIDGAVQVDSTITVGADDQGYDIKFFGDTASAYMLWDTSADDLVLAGAAGIDLAGDIDVDGTANLDAVDIDGAVQIDNTVTVGVNDTGYDVKFFGATSGAYMLWDESTDDLVLAGASKLYLYDAAGGEYLSSSGSALTIASGGVAWELPAADGSANQLLKTDGSGNLDWTTVAGTITALNNATANEIVTVGSTTTELDAEGNFTYDGNNAALTSSTSTNPIISVTNTNTDANGSILRFIKDAGEAGAANDISGLVSFYADDADQNNQEFGRITGRVVDATSGGEEGALDFYVAEYDGTVTKGMEIKGLASDGNITVDISTHDGSAGGLMLGSTLVTSTATELNLMDGGTTAGTIAVASGDGIVTNDGGTMRQTTLATFDTYLSASTKTLTNKTLTEPKFADAGYIADASGNELVILQTTSSAVNQFDVANAATGNDPTITATGGDSNVGLGIVAKGSGVIQITTTMNPTLTSTGKALVLGF